MDFKRKIIVAITVLCIVGFILKARKEVRGNENPYVYKLHNFSDITGKYPGLRRSIDEIYVMQDGDVKCYIYKSNIYKSGAGGISCLKMY